MRWRTLSLTILVLGAAAGTAGYYLFKPPVVTVSLGDSCVFRFGNTERPSRPYKDIELASGDLFVFGGPSRLAFHGVPKIYGGTGNPNLGIDGRVSVTLRQVGKIWQAGDAARHGRRNVADDRPGA